MVKALLLLCLLAVIFVAARWFLPIGPARAISGEMLEVGRQRINLYGIETGEVDELCGGSPCGALARQELADLVDGRYVFCLPYDRDSAGVFRGLCWAGTTELSDAMVRSGLAMAKPTGTGYTDAEQAARERGRGVWDASRAPPAQPGAARVPLVTSTP